MSNRSNAARWAAGYAFQGNQLHILNDTGQVVIVFNLSSMGPLGLPLELQE